MAQPSNAGPFQDFQNALFSAAAAQKDSHEADQIKESSVADPVVLVTFRVPIDRGTTRVSVSSIFDYTTACAYDGACKIRSTGGSTDGDLASTAYTCASNIIGTSATQSQSYAIDRQGFSILLENCIHRQAGTRINHGS